MGRALVICLCLLPGAARAAGSESTVLGGGLRMAASLLLIVGGVYLSVYLLKKRGGFLPGRRSGAIAIREMVPLGGKRSLCLVRVHGRELLLGLGGDRIERLGEFEPGDDFAESLDTAMEKKSP